MVSSSEDSRRATHANLARRPRVAHVVATYPPYWAGIGNVAYYNARELAKRGYDLHVFTAQRPMRGYQDDPGVTVHRLWTPLRIGNAPLTPGLLAALPRYDLVHLHWPFIFGAELTWLALRSGRAGVPYVMTYHLDLRSDRRRLFGIYQRMVGPRLADGARKIIAVSIEHLRSSQIYPSVAHRMHDVVEVPNGVDTAWFHPGVSGVPIRERFGIPGDAGLILFVGALDSAHEYKGVPDLMQAFGLLRAQRVPEAWLLLVGGGDLAPAYRELAARLPAGGRERVLFAGAVPHELLPPYYAAADVCVLPSRQPESFGIVLIESMACAKPVVASASPGVCSVVEDEVTGLLVRGGDIASLAGALERLLRDPVTRRAMGRRGRMVVETKYGWESVGAALEEVYESVLPTGRRKNSA